MSILNTRNMTIKPAS